MSKNQHHQLFLLFCLSASIILLFFIVKPLLAPLVMAGVFAFLFQPVFRRLKRFTKGRDSLSAFLVALLSIILIIIPITVLGTMILKEATGLYQDLSSGNSAVVLQVEAFLTQAKSSFPLLESTNLDISSYASQGLQVLTKNVGSIFSSFARIILILLAFLIALYYFLKDGGKFTEYLVELSPLEDKDDRFIVNRLKAAVHSTVKGNLIVGLIQGVVTAVGFAIFGVPNPVLWGGVSVITALIPSVGTALVLGPAIAYLFISGATLSGIGLTVWAVLAIVIVDNMIGPKLVGQGMKLHPLAVFVSVIGGMALFGPLGFILGPLALSITLALVDIYFAFKKKHIL